ncbi:zinc finger, CCHC-type containing protein [Tanacetum coccineum]
MGYENPIRTLGDYSKPSHEGYRNTIEHPVGNNVVPLRSDTIRLVQNGCSFHGLRSEDPNQHLKDFLKLVDSLDLDGENRERTRLRLFQFSLRDQASNWLKRLPAGSITTWEDLTTHFLAQFFPPGRTAKLRNDILMFQQHHGESLSEAWTRFKDLLRKVPHHGLDLWLQVQIFYDHIDCTTQMGIDYAAGDRLSKLRPDEAWATIERLAQYGDEGWNDAFIPVEMSLNYENPDIEQLLGIMERKVNTLMKDTISLMGRSESIFRMTTNEMYRPPSEPSRQEEFEDIVMNFILDQEEIVKQLEEYMKVIVGDFMQLSSEVTRGLKEKIREEGSRIRKFEKITKYPDIETMSKRQRITRGQSSLSQEVSIEEKVRRLGVHQLNYETLARRPIHSGDVIDWEFLAPQNLDQAFFNSISTDPFSGPQWGNLFRVNEPVYQELVREFFASFEFDASPCRENATLLIKIMRCNTVKESRLLMEFWPTIRDGGFNVGNTKVASIRDPRVKLTHHCIATTIAGRKETTHRVIKIDPYYLYYIYTPEIARSFGLLTNEFRNILSIEHAHHVFKKKSFIAMGIIMELQNGMCAWPAVQAIEEEEDKDDNEGDEAAGGDESIYDAWTRFKNLIQRVPHHSPDLWSLTQFFYDHVDDYTRMDLDFVADGNLRELSGEEAWEAIENFAQGQKEWDNPPNIISEQEVEMHRGIAWDKVENPDPQSTPQVFPSFEEYAPPMTYPEEVEETIGTPIESRRRKKSPEPPIKPHSPDSFKMKEVDSLTINTPHSPHVATFHPEDMYCYYHPCIDDPKKHYGFKPGFIFDRRSLEVLRKFHWIILGGRFNQLSHVSSPLLSKPGEY